MGQITIYLDDETEAKMRAAAKAMHISKSKWIANIIKEKIANDWPEPVRQLSGAWKDLPTAEELRKNEGKDITREEI